ncbi:hypothetical protein EXE63_06940 [Mycolicibacterium frederiksbergense]|uniref:Uncharacterized protein n=1 Tax=Mycolicibacterium frederiksbergense TaxID=117567 RepID=A0A6H0RZM4_9MYCO|nr:hypothetical protein EXE63_06940 [Mycolicibacterium frederiksbergense]
MAPQPRQFRSSRDLSGPDTPGPIRPFTPLPRQSRRARRPGIAHPMEAPHELASRFGCAASSLVARRFGRGSFGDVVLTGRCDVSSILYSGGCICSAE